MFWKWFWKVLALLLVVAIFTGGSIAIYQAGYAQGVLANLSVTEEGAPVVPHGGQYYRTFGLYRLFFPGLGLFFCLIMMLTLFGAIGRFTRYSLWKSKGTPDPCYWGYGWHRHHHPDIRQADRASDAPTEKGEAEEEATSNA